ncbi:MAG: NADH-quinone oxidoreductase subunit H [Candidatus Riflebacteria bacterium]|nr:NADH-quinone oxidoreductase subunit H [Candidatus Riflebacteria bacterium]
MANNLFQIIFFPGFLFLLFLGLVFQFIDRKVYARIQNRQGPPWFQPLADLIKLLGKEDIIPASADPLMFTLMPVFAVAGVVTAYLYIPTWGAQPLFSFYGDLIVVVYLLTIPGFTFFLGGWFSASLYSLIGAMRSQIQFFSYEVPMFLAVLAPALLANTWSMNEMAKFYSEHPGYWIINLLGFAVAIVALIGKLERVPFDSPEAETEIIAGSFTEYGGRFLAFFRLALDMELVVGASLIAAVFFPFGLNFHPFVGFFIYLLKIALVILITTFARAIMARLRIDQMVEFCWTYLAPAAIVQVIISLIAKGVLNR